MKLKIGLVFICLLMAFVFCACEDEFYTGTLSAASFGPGGLFSSDAWTLTFTDGTVIVVQAKRTMRWMIGRTYEVRIDNMMGTNTARLIK